MLYLGPERKLGNKGSSRVRWCLTLFFHEVRIQASKIKASEEFDKQVVSETREGELIPIVPDWRGRAFFQDPRLRDRDVELVVKRQKGTPYLQVLMVFTFDQKGARQYTDYYCDTCAFPMYEVRPCECCQGPVRLPFQTRELPEYIRAKHSKPGSGSKP